MNQTTRVKRKTLLAILLFVFAAGITLYQWWGLGALSLYGIAAFSIMGTKLFLSLLPAKKWDPVEPGTIRLGGVVTIYNEDPQFLKMCLDSLVAQTYPADKIVLVDDCSPDLAAYEVAKDYAKRYPELFITVRQDENKGKRHALARGFELLADDVDVFICVDSDTILEPNAFHEGVRPFSDEKVTAATGLVIAANHESNILTRLIDVRYINAFLGERAAYSVLGSVLCVCGSLAFYRKSALMPRLEGFLNQRFLNQVATVGDDRHLTNLCLLTGEVRMVENSIGHTAVPEKFNHYLRQQARWGRSFFRESLWALKHQTPKRPAFWLTTIELLQWLVFTSLLIYAAAIHPLITGNIIVAEYLLFVGLMAFARSVRYFDVDRVGQSIVSKALSFLASPLYGYMNLLIMIPLRMFSLFTLSTTTWGTRQSVEVSAASTLESGDVPELEAPARAEAEDTSGVTPEDEAVLEAEIITFPKRQHVA